MIGDLPPLGTVAGYEERYKIAQLRADKEDVVKARANLIRMHKDRYMKVEAATGVPWYIIACIHNQESGRDVGIFQACLHNGERIIGTGKKTTLVPKDRGPFYTWEEAAIDALNGRSMPPNWSLGEALLWCERYNGRGYLKRGIASPYIWAMTDQYTKGHYVADGKFDANAVSKNFGIVAILKALGV